MAYHLNLIDQAEREARIQNSTEASSEVEDFYDFRDTKTQLKVIRVPIELPIYRMANFRTFSEQNDYAIREGTSVTFFQTGQENESVQQVQHDILARLARKGKANSVVPVIDVLRREGQRDSLLITHRGVVVNGNRRLAAMRELYSGDGEFAQQFSHVTCKVLPADTTPNDILDIEGKLQAKPETRLDYDWIGDAQLLKAMLKAKGTPDAVAKFLGRKPKEVKNALQALTEADIYLKDWANADGQYGLVAERGEQFFKDLPAQLEGKNSSLTEASRVIAWTLFDNGGKLGGRLYSYNAAFGARAEDVLDQLAEYVGVSLSSDNPQGDDEYEFDAGVEPNELSYDTIVGELKNHGPSVVDSLISICDEVMASERDERSGSAALKAASSANAKLAEIDLSRAAKDTYESIQRQIEAVVQRATDLLTKIKEIRAESEKIIVQTVGEP